MPLKTAALFGFAFLLVAAAASADDDPKARAKEAYARGLAAHDARDYAAAARAFAEADSILPSTTALGAALDAAILADDPVLGAELLDRGERPGATAELTKSLADARARLGGRAGKIRIACPEGAACSALVDERTTTNALWVSAGPHTVTTRVDTTLKEQTIDVRPGETIVLQLERQAPVAQPATASSDAAKERAPRATWKVLPPYAVYIGGGLTLALAGGAITTGVLVKNRHDAFVAKGCARGAGPDCQRIRDEGVPLLIGTNLFIVGAAITAVATAVLGVVFTDWHPTVKAGAAGAELGFERRF